jgi:hypothetical protein
VNKAKVVKDFDEIFLASGIRKRKAELDWKFKTNLK